MKIKEKIYNEIIADIKENKDIYFSEIETIFERNKFEYKGNKTILDGENTSILIWAGWNHEAIDIIFKLFNHPNINARPVNNYLEILLQGVDFGLPLAKRRKYAYKKIHWLPSKLVWRE